VKGLPFCAPDPTARVYRITPALVEAAEDIAKGRVYGLEELLSYARSGAGRFLAADRMLVERAGDGWLLKAATAYEEALRAEPEFVDATRARMNLAIAYRAMGFAPELRLLSVRQNAASPFAHALFGEVLLFEGRRSEANEAFVAAAKGGGIAACLAARGLAEIALLEGALERASAGIAGLIDLCPDAVLEDPDTERLRAVLRAKGGDVEAAIARLEFLEDAIHPSERGRFLLTLAGVAEDAGQLDRARRAYERLARGEFGSALERRGTVGLARLDAAQGRLVQGLHRLDTLSPDGRGSARQGLMAGVSAEVLKDGQAAEAVAIVHSEQVDPEALAADQQILLARRYRELGFPDHGARLLLALKRSRTPEEQPVELWSEIGENSLVRGDASSALGAADEWRGRAGENPGELALRMRALAELGAAPGLVDQVAASLEKLDPVAAARVRIELARRDLRNDPARARALTDPVVAAPVRGKLAEGEAAAALWIHAEASERLGDDGKAIDSFRALVQEHPQSAQAAPGGYRLARVAARKGDHATAAIGYDAAEKAGDPLIRRVAVAARTFDELVRPLAREEKP
jgi:tetratricopeptide (TPR) repeat protein